MEPAARARDPAVGHELTPGEGLPDLRALLAVDVHDHVREGRGDADAGRLVVGEGGDDRLLGRLRAKRVLDPVAVDAHVGRLPGERDDAQPEAEVLLRGGEEVFVQAVLIISTPRR
jgi:hypothetical protein